MRRRGGGAENYEKLHDVIYGGPPHTFYPSFVIVEKMNPSFHDPLVKKNISEKSDR